MKSKKTKAAKSAKACAAGLDVNLHIKAQQWVTQCLNQDYDNLNEAVLQTVVGCVQTGLLTPHWSDSRRDIKRVTAAKEGSGDFYEFGSYRVSAPVGVWSDFTRLAKGWGFSSPNQALVLALTWNARHRNDADDDNEGEEWKTPAA